MLKKVLPILLTFILILSMIGCGNQTNEGSASGNENNVADEGTGKTGEEENGGIEKIEEIVFAFPVPQVVPGIQMVEDEVNKITEEKIGVHVKFEPIAMSNYSNQVGMMMTSNEQLDVITFLGEYSNYLAKNQLMNMDDYIDVYGSGAKKALGEEFLSTTSKNGSIYALPTLNGKAAVVNIVLRKDILEENNISTDNLKIASTREEYYKNLDELTDIFAKISEAEPDMVCLAPTSGNTMCIETELPFVDRLNDGFGVIFDEDGTTVTNMYESDVFKKMLEYTRKWYQEGYILQDAATTSEEPNTYLRSGRVAGYFIVGEEGQAEQIETATGVPVVSIKLIEAYITTAKVNGSGFGIASTSQHPEAAMKFLNEMYTNADIVNLLDWGVEGVHYVKNDDGTIGFPEGVDANTSTYNLNLDWLFGNQFLSYIWGEGRDTAIYEKLDYNNKNANFSNALGFSYDSTPVRNELTALQNVTSEYLPGLATGTLDPETELPKFIQALEDAGIQKVIDEKQKQLDDWLAENQ